MDDGSCFRLGEGPLDQITQDRRKAPGFFGHFIFDADRDFQIFFSHDQMIPLELTECLGQHGVGNPVHAVQKLIVPAFAVVHKGTQDRQFPLSSNALQRALKRTLRRTRAIVLLRHIKRHLHSEKPFLVRFISVIDKKPLFNTILADKDSVVKAESASERKA